MGKVNKKEMPMWAKTGHKKPVTRREFLAHGLIPFAASMYVAPGLGLLSPSNAIAQQINCTSGGSGYPAFVTVNLAGGASLASNYMPTDAGGAPLASYSKIGNGSGAAVPARTVEFGVAGWNAQGTNGNTFLTGVRARASAAALAKTSFVALCVQSRDDSSANRFDVSGMAHRAGVTGSILPNMGRRGSATGNNNMAAVLNPPPPLVVNSFQSMANSIGYTRSLASQLTAAQRGKLVNLVSNLNASQTQKLASINSTAGVDDLIQCAGIKNVGLLSQGANAINPLSDAAFGAAIGTIYGINNGTADNNEQRVQASMVYNALNGQSGSVTFDLGGYDYHDNTRTTGDTRDRAAGETIGRMIEMANVMNRKLFVYVTSDGATVSTDSATAGSNWVSDRGNAGMAFLFMFDPAGRPTMTGSQVGHYNAGQEAEASTLIGNNPELAAQAAFANYTKFAVGNNYEALFHKVVPRVGNMTGANLASVIKKA